MATKKRKTTTRRSTSRKKRAEQRLPAGLGTLFAGLLLVGLAFVEGDSVWKTLHQVLFGLFGCGSFVLGAAVCCLAVLYTRGEDLLPHICKLALGLVFASGTVIVFSDIQPQGLSAFQMVAACYQNGYQEWLSGGALGAVLGGNLLLLCGRPAANFIMLVLALCVSLYIFDLTPAEVWQWLCDVSGGVHAKGVAVYEQGAARRAERRAERQAAQEAADEYDETEDLEEYEDEAEAEEPFRLGLPDWMSGVLHWGHKVTQELEQAPDSPAGAPDQPVQPQPEPQAAPAVTPVRVRASRPRAPFDVDLGPDSTEVKEGGSEPIEPFIPGPGGTFGMDPLRAAPKPTILIGCGRLGKAVSRFITTDANGYKLIAAFDVAQNEVGKEINGIQIRHVDELEVFCAEHHPKVAVLCVPRDGAEQVSGRLVDLGIEGFWNFSHYDLSVPYPDVVVENVHLGDSLMSLGYRLRNQE